MHPCCEDPKNRTEPEQVVKDVAVTRCKECGRKHYESSLPPIRVGITGGRL